MDGRSVFSVDLSGQDRSECKDLGKLERLGSAPAGTIQSKIQGWKSRKGNSLLLRLSLLPGAWLTFNDRDCLVRFFSSKQIWCLLVLSLKMWRKSYFLRRMIPDPLVYNRFAFCWVKNLIRERNPSTTTPHKNNSEGACFCNKKESEGSLRG